MIKNIKKGHTLLVKGPTRITLLEGKLELLGKIISLEKKNSKSNLSEFDEDNVIIIPGANHYPLFALENSKLEIYTSNEIENLTLIEENSISSRWVEIKDDLVSRLEAKLRQNPEDIEGWIMLARTYEVLGEKKKSLRAYKKVRIQIRAMIDGLPDNHEDIDDLKMLLKKLPKS